MDFGVQEGMVRGLDLDQGPETRRAGLEASEGQKGSGQLQSPVRGALKARAPPPLPLSSAGAGKVVPLSFCDSRPVL